MSNEAFLAIADRVTWLHAPRLPEVTPEGQCLIDAYNLILEARIAMDRTLSEAQRYARQRAWLIKTDPTVYPVELGGEGAPLPEPEPVIGDAP